MANSIYTKEYFLSDCEGYIQYNSSKGRELCRRLKKLLGLSGVSCGMRVLDAGCGRGELVLHAADRGAFSAGVELSAAALEIASGALRNWGKKDPRIKDKACFIKADVCWLPFKADAFDIAFLSDIIEHLSPPDLEKTLLAVYRVVKPGGKVILHSSPNRIFIRYGLKLYNLLGKLCQKNFNWDMRAYLPQGCQKEYHLNEQTIFSLKRSLRRAGFRDIRLWLEKNPQYIYYFFKEDAFIRRVNLMYKILPVKHLFFADIYGVVSR